jgi:hypothetical protein
LEARPGRVDGGFSAVYSTWSRFQRALETGSYADSVRPLSFSFSFSCESWELTELGERAGSTPGRDLGARQ